MSIEEELSSNVGSIIIVIVVLIAFFVLINSITDGGLVRMIVCGVTFWIPFGASVSQYCRAIPV